MYCSVARGSALLRMNKNLKRHKIMFSVDRLFPVAVFGCNIANIDKVPSQLTKSAQTPAGLDTSNVTYTPREMVESKRMQTNL